MEFDIKTGYYAKAKSYGSAAIGISRGVPKFWSGENYFDLAPTWNTFNQKSMTRYNEMFNKQLEKLDPYKVATDLNGRVLMCYEKSGDHCHRRLVADWLRKHLSIWVPEVGYKGVFDFGDPNWPQLHMPMDNPHREPEQQMLF